ncbi:MAG: ATP-binding protein [Pyramidobacter sp.]|nr:ATP-binding protein [Pyramidobacter sp.]
MYIPRHLEGAILEASHTYPVVMLCGQRQVGKSTLLRHIAAAGRRYVTLDDVSALRLAQNDPELFFETYQVPLLIDEFQRAPGLLLEIKRRVDEKTFAGEPCAGDYWLTGSQKFAMMKGASESLAGRVAVFELAGLSAAEIDGRPAGAFSPLVDDLRAREEAARLLNVREIYERVFRGGMPRVVTGEAERERYYMDYVATYLEKDVRALAQVGKLSEFQDFLVYMAARTGQELKYADAARALGVSSPTVKEWTSILEASGVIVLLRPWHSSLSKRLVKTPKVYFMDTGLAAWLCRWPTVETLESGAMDGAFFETYVVTEILKSFMNAGLRHDLSFYRDSDGREIDLLLERGGHLWPIEIKKSKNPANPDRHFSALGKFGTVEPGVVVCMTDELVPYNRRAWLFPVWAL